MRGDKKKEEGALRSPTQTINKVGEARRHSASREIASGGIASGATPAIFLQI